MLGGVERTIIGGFSSFAFGYGLTLCLNSSVPLAVFGGALALGAILITASVVSGRPIARLGPSEESQRHRTPGVAPVSYQVRQLRQVLKEWEWGDFTSADIWNFWPQVIRTRTVRKYEPMHVALSETIFLELESRGELTRGLKPGTWRVTGKS